LQSNAHTAALFPQQFVARVRVIVGAELTVEFEVENTGAEPFDYEIALHSYLAVGDVREVSISGLQGAGYFDKVSNQHSVEQVTAPFKLSGETDRVYDSTARVVVDDPRRQRQLIIDKSGSASTVVWNPWQPKAAKMADFTADSWPKMLCIETANVNPRGIHLQPQTRHCTTTALSAQHSGTLVQ
jgi:glucose-6-phosphate 1-epimerase